MELYDAWRRDGVPFEMHAAGLLFAFVTEQALHHVLHGMGELEAYGYSPPEALSGDGVRTLCPILSHGVMGGFLVERDRHVEPWSLTQGLAGRLRSEAVDLRPWTVVSGFVTSDGGSRLRAVSTNRGEIEGDAFLIAAGAWSGPLARLAGFRLPVESGKGYSITIEQPQAQLPCPVYLDEARVGVSPFGGALRFAGTMELSGLSERVDRRRLDAMRRSVSRYLTSWPRGEREIEWAGMRPLLPDGLPALGRAPCFDNLFVATGHSMLGVTLAPATGEVMAELLCEDASRVDLRPFDPGRFAG
jgi:D-amino-acid dehydrogenase